MFFQDFSRSAYFCINNACFIFWRFGSCTSTRQLLRFVIGKSPCLSADGADSLLNNLMRRATGGIASWGTCPGWWHPAMLQPSFRWGQPQNPRHRSDEKHRVSVPFPPLSSGGSRRVSSIGERPLAASPSAAHRGVQIVIASREEFR